MTELKTLKDLNEKFRKDNIPQRLSGDEFNDYWENILRAVALGWIKEDKKWYLIQKAKISRGKQIGDTTSDLIKRWMKRLNLSKEDLE